MKILEKLSCREEELFLALLEETDAPVLALCEAVCFPSDPWSEASFAENIKNPACRMYAALDRQMQNIVAYGVLYLAVDEGDLANIATLPDMRNRGVGGALLDAMLEKAFGDGALRIFLEVRESNSSARGLYASRGFAEIGKRKRYYKNPTEDAVLMMLER